MARRAPASTKSDLLNAAEACFISSGLDATKIEDITSRIGIAKGAFYSYFESKEACWRHIVEEFLARLAEVVDMHGAALNARAPLPERLEIWLAHDLKVFEFCWDNRSLLGLLMSGSGGIAYAHLLDEFARRAASNAEDLVRTLIAEGVYQPDVDPKLVACMLGGAYDRLARELVRAPKRPDLNAMLRDAQRVFLHGLLTDSSRRELARATAAKHAARARAPKSVSTSAPRKKSR